MLDKIYNKETYPLLKKRIGFFFLFSFFFFLFSFSQNLLTNGCFEIYSSCPNGGGQISYATGWSNTGPLTTPDYFNTCTSFPIALGVPTNMAGFQNDSNGGGAYAGIFALSPPFPNDGREYVQTQLTDTLQQYHLYLATAHVSLSNFSSYAVSSLGLLFSQTAIQSPGGGTFINVPNPQVKGSFSLTDTSNWMVIQDTFVAQGGELYLTIGNFSYDSLSDSLYLGWRGQNSSYYYIDSVTVFDTGLTGVPELGIQNSEFRIFPNPNNGNFEIEYAIKENAVLEISDLQGRVLKRKDLNTALQRATIQCESLENGVYLYKVVTPDFETQIKKLIIVK